MQVLLNGGFGLDEVQGLKEVFRPTAAENRFLPPPPKYVEHFTFGFNLMMADSFWLRWIQDSDFCQTYKGFSRAGHPEKQDQSDKLIYNVRHKVCDNSWGFLMLDAVTRLDPRYPMAYEGAIILSVLVEDYQGATVIFDRGLKVYPDDWRLLYRAAYHFLFDVHDLKRAAELLNHAGDVGAPTWVKSLAARLYSRLGQLDLGISTLEAYKKTLTEKSQIEKVEVRLREMREQKSKAEVQLEQ